MKFQRSISIVIVILCFSSFSWAENEHAIRTDPVTKERYFLFPSSKGNVRFNHDLHQAEMKDDSCIPCHKTRTPTKVHTMTRFDQRVAHSFCKGCHREKGRGPLECHECHKNKK
jgi:hypothetical protein